MNNQRWFQPLLITLLLCCAAPLSAADVKPAAPVPWHVADAEVRVPVSISPDSAVRYLGRATLRGR